MGRKVKFSLFEEEEVFTIKNLQDNFILDRVVEVFENERLKRWVKNCDKRCKPYG